MSFEQFSMALILCVSMYPGGLGFIALNCEYRWLAEVRDPFFLALLGWSAFASVSLSLLAARLFVPRVFFSVFRPCKIDAPRRLLGSFLMVGVLFFAYCWAFIFDRQVTGSRLIAGALFWWVSTLAIWMILLWRPIHRYFPGLGTRP